MRSRIWIHLSCNADADPDPQLWCMGFDADPDPAFYLNADQDPDPGSQPNVDPDPSQTLKSQKVEFLHERNR
jgi:hypothetical protein